MASVKRICMALIKNEKKKANPNFESIIAKMDVYLAADRLTADEYNELMDEINA